MKVFEPLPQETEQLAKVAVDAAFKVHTSLGPGLLESIYETCLAYELRKRGVPVETQVIVPVLYDGIRLESGLRIDLLVSKQFLSKLKLLRR